MWNEAKTRCFLFAIRIFACPEKYMSMGLGIAGLDRLGNQFDDWHRL